MNKFFLASFACFINVVSFGQTKSEETVVYDLGTMVMFEEWTTDHVILPVKKTDVEMKGLKGPVTFFKEEILRLTNDHNGFSKFEIFKETMDFDFNGKQKSCQRTIEQSKWQKFEYVLDKNGFIHEAQVSNPYTHDLLGTEYYKYDSLGNVSATRMENSSGQVESKTFKFYNTLGELIEEKTTNQGKVVFWEKYERSNRKIQIDDKLNGEVWQGELNEKGDVIRLVNLEKNQTQEFTYVYDTWGNWTSRMKSLNGVEVQEGRRAFNYETYAERTANQTPVPVKVGKQVWMSENLNVKKFNNGDLIEQAQSSSAWIKALEDGTPAWCYCEDLSDNLTKDVLYNYFALTDTRGLAPQGYRIATLDDWNILFKKYGGLEGAFEKLKDTEKDVLNTADMRGYRRGTWMLPETYWWTKDGKKIGLAVDYIGTMLIVESVEEEGYYNDGLFLRCVKE
jgi:uncharacterized protein (TIGR02145 family)